MAGMCNHAWALLAERYWLAGVQTEAGPGAALDRLHDLVYTPEPERPSGARAAALAILGI